MPAQDLWALAEYVSQKGTVAREQSSNHREKFNHLAETGRALYQGMCAACHGPNGDGDGPAAASLNPRPKDFTRRAFAPEAFARLVRNGVEGSGMVGFALDDSQVNALAAYVAGFYNGEL
jgi:mono/diheme cytochrome c family protein